MSVMTVCRRLGWKRLGLISFLALVGAAISSSLNSAVAQITPDGTLGAERSQVTPTPLNPLVDQIDGGAIRGSNLFHSFQEFNISEGRGAYFANPAGIENIINRVTGGNPSQLFGTLGVLGNANLFFLNPNGIIFGPNARLDISGSFVASTASSLTFSDGTKFSATNPQAPPLLTVNVPQPIGLHFEIEQPRARITNTGNLAVGKDLTLFASNLDLQRQLYAGGNLTLQAQDTVQVRDSTVAPFIASAGGQLLVQGNQGVDIFALNHPASGFFSVGDMVLRSANTVGGDARYWTGSNFQIEQLDGSPGNLYSPYDPIIRSKGDVNFNNYYGTSLHILAGGSVNLGTVLIAGKETGTSGIDYIAENVSLSNGKVVQIDGSKQPTLDVRAGINPDEVGNPGFTGVGLFLAPAFNLLESTPNTTVPATSANITVKDIVIAAPNGAVLLTNQYKPNTSLAGGEIQVTANGFFSTGIYTSSDTGGGSVTIDSRSRITLNGDINAFGIDSSGKYSGNGGDITLIAEGDITTNSKILSNGLFGGNIALTSRNANVSLVNGAKLDVRAGSGGSIRISAQNINISQGSQIYAGIGDFQGSIGTQAGDITLNATGAIALGQQSLIRNEVSSSGIGNSGNIKIQAGSFSLSDDARVVSSTSGQGNAGQVFIQADGAVSLTTGGIFSNVESGGVGNGGDITIKAKSFSMTDGAELQTVLREGSGTIPGGRGKAGNVNITVEDAVTIVGNPRGYITAIFSEVNLGTVGNGGDINITAKSFSLSDGAALIARTRGQGNAGNVFIQADGFASVANSAILNNVEPDGVGNGGDIKIQAGSFSLTDGARLVSSTSGQGNAGNVFIQADGFASVANSAILNNVEPDGVGNGGDIKIQAGSFSLTDGARLVSSTSGQGNAGSVFIQADGAVSTAESAIFSNVESGGVGNGGDITIKAKSFSMTDGAELQTVLRGARDTIPGGRGKAGNVNITVEDAVTIVGNPRGYTTAIFSEVNPGTVGNGGDINITAKSFSLSDGAALIARTRGQGNAGNVFIQADGFASVANSGILNNVEPSGVGNGGDIKIQAGSFSLTDGARLVSSTSGQGNAGSVFIQADGFASVANSAILNNVEPGGVGNGGDIKIQAGSFSLTDGARLVSSTSGQGNAGSVFIQADGAVSTAESAIFSNVESGGVGNGGDITIKAKSFSMTDGAELQTVLRGARDTIPGGRGKAGNVNITVEDAVTIVGNPRGYITAIFSEVNPGSVGNGGDINITAKSFSLSDGAALIARTRSQGDAGNIYIKASDLTTIAGARGLLAYFGLYTDTNTEGKGGDITVDSSTFRIADGAVLNARTTARGNGGKITVNTDTFEVASGGQLIATTSDSGNAGNITVNAIKGKLTISGSNATFTDRVARFGGDVVANQDSSSGLFTTTNAVGDGGDINVNTSNFRIANSAQLNAQTNVAVNGGNGGQIKVNADNFEALSGGRLIATTLGSGDAGKIIVNPHSAPQLSDTNKVVQKN